MPKNNDGLNVKNRMRGETTKNVAHKLIYNPVAKTTEIASELKISEIRVREIIRALYKNPSGFSAIHKMDEEQLRAALEAREECYTKPNDSVNKTSNGSKWRGKINWPASKTATKKSMSNKELVIACGQHYVFNNDNGKYIINQDEIDKATIYIKDNKNNKKDLEGRPTIPMSFTFKQYL